MKLELESPTAESQFFAGDLSQPDNFVENADQRFNEMLKAGIRAAQEGNRAEARQLLLRVTDNQPENENAWLWLASISEYPEELLGFLNNVLRVNPENERALEWAKATKSLMAKTLVQRGINSSRENQKETARQFFEQALAQDAENELAWLWLASVADSPEQKAAHLEKVLSINPDNETAQASLKSVRQQNAQTLLKRSNVAAISGDHDAAREMLGELMQFAPEMEEAWILKAYLAPAHDEKLECFNRVLALNPENETAQAGIASLNALRQREIEAAAQRAELENLKASEVPAPEFFALVSEETENAVNEPAAFAPPEEPEILAASPVEFAEPENQFSAEEFRAAPEEEPEQDSPTQELDEKYLQSVAEEIGFSFQTEETPVQEFHFAEPQAEDAPVEFVADAEPQIVQDEMTAVEIFAEMPVEAVAESKDFTMVAAEENFVETPSFQDFAAPEANSNEVENDDFAENGNYNFFTINSYSEGFEQRLAEGLFETEHEEILMEESFEQNVEPSFEEYGFAPVKENGFESPAPETASAEPQEFFEEPRAIEMPTESFEAATESFETPRVEFSEESVAAPPEAEFVSPISFEQAETVENNSAAPPVAEQAEEVRADEPPPFAPEEENFAAKHVVPQAEPLPCPFCHLFNEPQAFVCHSCRAVLSLSDVEMMLAHSEADKERIEMAARKMEAERERRQFSAEETANLGVAHLNLKNLRKGFDYLQEAVGMNPNNLALAAHVHSLAIRLAEIEQQEESKPEAKSRTIMVVDDSAAVRKLISGKLEKCGHTVVLAVDGMDALAKINEVTPDLILLDITMPRLDGYQVCKLIRNNAATKEIPVVMISGRDGFFDKVRGRMAGSTGYITKPFGPDTLMKTIEAYF
jgi:CheY-like chemotaxis protein/tetratricopeptide (TPR) repeat protein